MFINLNHVLDLIRKRGELERKRFLKVISRTTSNTKDTSTLKSFEELVTLVNTKCLQAVETAHNENSAQKRVKTTKCFHGSWLVVLKYFDLNLRNRKKVQEI